MDRKEFFSTFEERHAVQYFYEPFLEAFDPDLRKQLGVWYTPPEIVQYMVARIDTVLREELEIADGLADKRVLILDPACGTGSYIVEVLHNIAQTLKKKGNDALLGHDLKMAAMERIFGFEILPAPFVVAHLQIGLFLQSAGTQLSEAKNERVSVYLTNSLTGWVHPSEPQKRLSFPELEKERDAADNVKRQKRILVILGNPPYNAFAGVSPREEQNLVEPYKEGLVTKWTIKKFNLDDLYIRFFRLAERRIVEQTGEGIICYVSNFSFLGGPSYVVMRKRFLDEFDKMWFDSMNGDSRETGKRTPDGKPDPSAFSTEKNPEGIRVGTVISLLVRKSKRQRKPTINYRDLWGVNKRENLLKSISEKPFNNMYRIVDPKEQDLYSFRASNIPRRYLSWPTLVELSKQQPFNGPVERRGGSLIKMKADKNKLDLVRDYLDPQKSSAEIKLIAPRFMTSSGEFKAEEARQYLVKTGVKYDHNKIVLFPFKPFDVRLAYLDANIQPLFSRPSPQLLRMREISGNAFLIARDTADKIPEGCPLYFSPLVCDYTFISGNTRHFPIWIYPEQQQKKSTKTSNIQSFQLTLAGEMEKVSPIANLSDASRKYLESLGLADPNTDSDTAETIWLHSLAIGYSPLYLRENSDGIRRGWPRIPLPDSKELLFDSAKLGKQIASLLDIRGTCAPRVTSILQDLKYIAVISRKGSVSLDPQAGDLKLTVGWGHGTELVMPGQGKSIERNYTDEEQVWISRDLKIKSTDIFRTLGETTYDIFLNDNTYWKNVPIRVWNYLIGGHQVLKKWLSYREFDVLNRSINPDEAREFSDIARRISGILLLEPALDENYYTVIRNIYKWTRIEDAI